MGINFTPNSTLGFILAITLIAYLGGVYIGRPDLSEAAKPFLLIAGGIWLVFILLTVIRNAKSI